MDSKVLWQIGLATLAGAICGMLWSIYSVDPKLWWTGTLLGAAIGFFACGPREAFQVSKAVMAKKVGPALSGIFQKISMEKILSACRTVWYISCTLTTILAITFVINHFFPTEGGGPVGLFLVILFALFIGALCSRMVLLFLTEGNTKGRKVLASGVCLPLGFRLEKWLRTSCEDDLEDDLGESFLFITLLMFFLPILCAMFILYIAIDTFLTIVLALAVTKRIAVMSGVLIGHVIGFTQYSEGIPVVGSILICCLIAIATAIGIYLVREWLKTNWIPSPSAV